MRPLAVASAASTLVKATRASVFAVTAGTGTCCRNAAQTSGKFTASLASPALKSANLLSLAQPQSSSAEETMISSWLCRFRRS